MGNFQIKGGKLIKYKGKETDVIIPKGVTSIGDDAFYRCSSLTNIMIPEGVTSIGRWAFCSCEKLKKIMIPDSVTSIGEGAFSHCSNLTSITLPEGVISIGEGAFYGCSNLTSITIPDSVINIGKKAFFGCEGLADPDGLIIIKKTLYNYIDRKKSSITIPEGVTSIGDYAFYGCISLTSIMIPDGVTSIGEYAFCDCSSLTSITIPEGVTSIGDCAFARCSSLTSIMIPEGVTSIGDYAFYRCSSLTSTTIPDSVTSIGDNAFSGCSRLKEILIPDGVTSIGDWTFNSCKKLKKIMIPDSVSSIGDYAFSHCSALTNTGITIPDSVTSIGKGAFYGCINLTEIAIPQQVVSVKEDTFQWCKKLVKLEVRNPKCQFNKDSIDAQPGLISALIPYFSDGAYKQYVLDINIWSEQEDSVRKQLFLSRQGKSISPMYKALIPAAQAEGYGQYVLDELTESGSPASCKAAVSFMNLFTQEASAELLQSLNAQLQRQKNADKLMKELKDSFLLQEKLGTLASTDEAGDPLEKRILELMFREKLSRSDVAERLQEYYSLNISDLPPVKKQDGNEVPPIVLAYLLTMHEKLGKEWRYEKPVPTPLHEQPGPSPEAAEIISQLDASSLQAALLQLADQNLGQIGFSKKMFLAYPICRYADETLMAELTNRAPKWRSSVSGNDAPPLRSFRMANLYNNTRAAMLFADKYGMLKEYAELRGMDEDTLRDDQLSDVGLDEKNSKAYDLGNQTVIARLQPDLSFLIELPDGKTAKSLPKKNADPEKYGKAGADFSELKKNVRKVIKNRITLLFDQFLTGETRRGDLWQHSYMNNPLLRHVASLLVWKQGRKYFTLADSHPVNAAGKSVKLTAANISLAHPMDMDDTQIAKWQKYFMDRGLKQPFAQVWEPVRNAADILPNRYEGVMIPYYRFLHQDKHGIHVYDEYFHNEIAIDFDDCFSDVEQIDIKRHEINPEDRFMIHDLQFRKYTRKVNHIIAYLDRITIWDRIRKDDPAVADSLNSFTLAQIQEFITIASEAQANNVLAMLLEWRNGHYPNYTGAEELTLDW